MTIEELEAKHPHLFLTRATGSCGYACGDGWVTQILEPLCRYIDYMQEGFTKSQVKFVQIKEKFGSLRVYVQFMNYTPTELPEYPITDAEETNAHLLIHGAVRFAEVMSRKICENTGKIGTLVSINGWYKTLSEDEIAKREQQGCTIKRIKEDTEQTAA